MKFERIKKLNAKYIVEITKLPTIAVYERATRNKNTTASFFAQGDDANKIIDESPEKMNITDYVLIYLESAGILSV